ncbi:hypothetical protein QAD02_014171 [Eretmocerus hayati]|uniref:Uncharacterized protein n=1 Tax=Eretmocerus hayati TaxID=131215 RepID=A0ACC2P468_9HYME|nr:hypothetical protein QAD02_014171 [Eretmocerus hayati]
MGTTKRRRKKHIIFNEADLLRCWYALEHKPNSFTPMMLVTKAAYSLKPKYIQLGQIYSVTHGDEDVAEFEDDMDCEEFQDERVEALEDETSFDETVPRSIKRKVRVLVQDSGNVEDLPPKRQRKSVMDGKFRDYSC